MRTNQCKKAPILPSAKVLATTAWILVCGGALLACGGLPIERDPSTAGGDADENTSFTPNSQIKSSVPRKKLSDGELGIPIGIPINISSQGFSLAAASATSYTISLTNCDSGYMSTANETSSSLQAYKYDSGCLAKLEVFTFNGYTFTPSVADPFSSWQVGDEAVFFAVEDPAVTLGVKIAATLDNSIDETDTVEYNFFDLERGADSSILGVTFGASGDRPGGLQPVPSFLLIKSVLVGGSAGGGLQYVYTLACSVAMIGNSCAGVDLVTIRYKLVKDTFNSNPTYADATAAFVSGSQSVNPVTDRLAAGQGGAANGGFVTTSGAGVLTSPAPIQSHPNMILFLEAGGSSYSYRYFNLDVAVSVQN